MRRDDTSPRACALRDATSPRKMTSLVQSLRSSHNLCLNFTSSLVPSRDAAFDFPWEGQRLVSEISYSQIRPFPTKDLLSKEHKVGYLPCHLLAVLTVLSKELIVIENCGVRDITLGRANGQFRLKVAHFAFVMAGDTIYFAPGYQPGEICPAESNRRQAVTEAPAAKRVRLAGRSASID